MLATMEGDRDDEAAIHGRFAHLRLDRTEQFRPASDLMAFIGRPLLVDPNPDAIEAMPQPSPIGFRVSGEYSQWVEEVARFCRTDVAKLVDAALADYAKARGFPKPPPERVP